MDKKVQNYDKDGNREFPNSLAETCYMADGRPITAMFGDAIILRTDNPMTDANGIAQVPIVDGYRCISVLANDANWICFLLNQGKSYKVYRVDLTSVLANYAYHCMFVYAKI